MIYLCILPKTRRKSLSVFDQRRQPENQRASCKNPSETDKFIEVACRSDCAMHQLYSDFFHKGKNAYDELQCLNVDTFGALLN